MQITVNMNDALLEEARHHAVRTGRTLTALLEDGLRSLLARETRPLPTFHGDGLRPGVDLDDSEDLLDVMDGLPRD